MLLTTGKCIAGSGRLEVIFGSPVLLSIEVISPVSKKWGRVFCKISIARPVV